MTHPWHDIELPRAIDDAVPVVIEIPRGSKVKYEVDKATGLLRVDRILHSAVHYPASYGFVPRTLCDDGDALDALVFCQEPIASLAIIRARVIGFVRMTDEKGGDDKLLCAAADDPDQDPLQDVADLPPHRLRELRRFFEDYKALESGARVEVGEPEPREKALAVLRDAVKLYGKKRKSLVRA